MWLMWAPWRIYTKMQGYKNAKDTKMWLALRLLWKCPLVCTWFVSFFLQILLVELISKSCLQVPFWCNGVGCARVITFTFWYITPRLVETPQLGWVHWKGLLSTSESWRTKPQGFPKLRQNHRPTPALVPNDISFVDSYEMCFLAIWILCESRFLFVLQ